MQRFSVSQHADALQSCVGVSFACASWMQPRPSCQLKFLEFEIFVAGATLGDRSAIAISQHNHPLSRKMLNLQFLLLNCLVVLMIIGSQFVSAQAPGAVYFRGSGSNNPQAIFRNRALIAIDIAFKAGETVAQYDGTAAGVCVAAVLICGICMYKIRKKCLAEQAEEALKERNRVATA